MVMSLANFAGNAGNPSTELALLDISFFWVHYCRLLERPSVRKPRFQLCHSSLCCFLLPRNDQNPRTGINKNMFTTNHRKQFIAYEFQDIHFCKILLRILLASESNLFWWLVRNGPENGSEWHNMAQVKGCACKVCCICL